MATTAAAKRRKQAPKSNNVRKKSKASLAKFKKKSAPKKKPAQTSKAAKAAKNAKPSQPVKSTATKKTDAQKEKLIKLGKSKGFLTYDEVNDHMPEDIGQAEVPALVAIGELLVIEAKQVQNRSL